MKEAKKKGNIKKIVLIVLAVILALIAVVSIVVAVIASGNVKAMDACVDAVLQELRSNHTVTAVDAGEYEELTIYGIMKFDVQQYDIEDVGNLSVMKVNMGVMQMATVVITPQDKNLPLLSADFMYILGNRKA